MVKIRITFVDTPEGNKELQKSLKAIQDKFIIINKSKVYKGRGSSQYSNIYLDLENKK